MPAFVATSRSCAAAIVWTGLLVAPLILVVLVGSFASPQQTEAGNSGNQGNSANQGDAANQEKAHQVLDATIQAIGGDAWVHLQSIRTKGRLAGFYQGNPTGSLIDYTEYVQVPDKTRIEFTKKGNFVHIFDGDQAWEITYKGKVDLPKKQHDAYLRWQAHSLRVALVEWYRDPTTILIYDGQTSVERHLADKVTLINKQNDDITLEMDAQSHYPLQLSFDWRDPIYHDKNHDHEEYDNYQMVDGIATPFNLTRYHNGEMTSQNYILGAVYNVPLRDGLFDPDMTAKHLR